jgi:3-phosphoshikimate 1-carboxyvinyltransferase
MEKPDGMVIQGLGRPKEQGRLTATNGQSHGDHRVAMSIAIGGLTALKETRVNDADCIETSFPDFYGKLLALLTASR